MAISSDGRYVALTDETLTFSIWDWRQQHLEILPWKYPQRIDHLVFGDEDVLLAVSEAYDWTLGCTRGKTSLSA